MSEFPMMHDSLYCASCARAFEWKRGEDGSDWIEGVERDGGDVERFRIEQECLGCAMQRHPHAGII